MNFWNKVDIKSDNECWNFKYGKTKQGYGHFFIYGTKVYAHRYALLGDNFKLIKKLVLHKCNNPACCNPNHLYLGDQSDNMADKITNKRNTNKFVGLPELYAGEIWLIRRLKKLNLTRIQISKMFKVHRKVIGRIWRSDKYLSKEGIYV